jgi:hypothetical protein
LSTKPDKQNPAILSKAEEFIEEGEDASRKKPFVEPEVSFPVDVLEATTFFVAADSGSFEQN